MSSSKVAVVDIGSNSTKVLIVSFDSGDSPRKIAEKSYTCRLFESNDLKIKSISKPVVQNLKNILEKLFKLTHDHDVSHIAIVATEAIRIAPNQVDVVREIENKFGYKINVLKGEEEAALIAKGVQLDPIIASEKRFQAFDLGGGSLELIEYKAESAIKAQSIPLGVLSLVAEFHPEREVALSTNAEGDLREKLRQQIQQTELARESAWPIVGLGGAVVFLRMILARCNNFKFEEASEISLCDISELSRKVCKMNLGERLAKFPELPSDRADVFPVACIVVEEILVNLGKTKLIHSFSNLRHGIASSLLTKPELFQPPCK